MQRRQVHVRVRIGAGEVIDALVLEWLSYPDRALVQLPSRQRPSVVRLNTVTGLYAPRSLPAPTPRLAVVLAGLVLGGVLLGFLVPASPPTRPVTPAAVSSWTPPPPARKPPAPPPQSQPPAPVPLAPAPRVLPLPDTAPRALAAPATTPPVRAPQPKPSSPSTVRYEARLTALSSEAVHHGAHVCECGATFHSARELEAHRTGITYACIRYPACKVTAAQPEAILKHYEKERDSGRKCWFEAVRLGSAYAVVKRPKCRTLAADPNRRKVIKVRVRPNPTTDNDPWH